MTPSRLTINETFYTFQGEGVNMGRAAFFIRTQGCDQDCWFCDSASTWHKRWKPTDLRKATPEELAAQVEDESPPEAMVVITGGEPCLYDLNPLVDLLIANGRDVAIETAGHRPLPDSDLAWITCSPKPFAEHPLVETVLRADEFKIIVSDATSLLEGLCCIVDRHPDAPVWLHPEWSHRNNPATMQRIVDAVKDSPRQQFRAGYQLHKLYMADLLDPGARKEPVPLGGDGAPPW